MQVATLGIVGYTYVPQEMGGDCFQRLLISAATPLSYLWSDLLYNQATPY
jgi:hypothetical protein